MLIFHFLILLLLFLYLLFIFIPKCYQIPNFIWIIILWHILNLNNNYQTYENYKKFIRFWLLFLKIDKKLKYLNSINNALINEIRKSKFLLLKSISFSEIEIYLIYIFFNKLWFLDIKIYEAIFVDIYI